MGTLRWIVVAILAPFVFSVPAALAQSSGPSFACVARQGVIEQTICSSAELSAADRTMAALYAASRLSAFGVGLSNELDWQRKSLADMRKCARPPERQTISQCLQIEYDGRNSQLAVAALMREPAISLAVLHKTDPGYAPVLEAVQVWAGEPRDADWSVTARANKRARVLGLLAPYFDKVMTRDDESYGRGLLTDPSQDHRVIKRIEDVLMSDRQFAKFLHGIGPYIDGAGSHALPCMAIVRHPALLVATFGAFGSTMDNFVLNSDCVDTLPPVPALSSLIEKLNAGWPDCDGTIRFLAFRVYQNSVDEARLGLTPHNAKFEVPTRKGVTSNDIDAARAALTTYYARYLSRPPQSAKAMAGDAINAILAVAQECE